MVRYWLKILTVYQCRGNLFNSSFQLILAMGNYMNKGNQRVGEAIGFKISFLSQVYIHVYANIKFMFLESPCFLVLVLFFFNQIREVPYLVLLSMQKRPRNATSFGSKSLFHHWRLTCTCMTLFLKAISSFEFISNIS